MTNTQPAEPNDDMENEGQDRKQPLFTLDRSTLVPIGLLISVVVSAIAATAWIQRTILDLDHKVAGVNERLAELTRAMDDRWTLTHQIAWAELLQARNPALSVPLPSRPR